MRRTGREGAERNLQASRGRGQRGRRYEDLERRERRGERVEANADRFAIVLPVEGICPANLFDDEVHRRYFDSTVGDAAAEPVGG
jgi:hypothetical protein